MKPHSNQNQDPHQPTQYQLSKIAAVISANCKLTGDHRGARACVDSALDLWKEAGRILAESSNLSMKGRDNQNIVGPFRNAMKVGKHLLPRISDEFLESDCMEFNEFLEMAVGLSETADRLKWLRAFIENWDDEAHLLERGGKHSPRSESYREFAKQGKWELARFKEEEEQSMPGWNPFGQFESEKEEIEDLDVAGDIARLKKEGIRKPAIFAASFRKWRLTMRTTTEKAQSDLSVEEAILRGSVLNR
jgi:hypothetical protein